MKHIDQMVINAKVAEALLHARLCLHCLEGSTVRLDGGELRIDNEREIKMINDALVLIGVDPSETAPMSRP